MKATVTQKNNFFYMVVNMIVVKRSDSDYWFQTGSKQQFVLVCFFSLHLTT